jgi:hypothetical protein
MEPPTTFYIFKIINRTNTILYIESRQDKFTALKYDTLKTNQELIKEIPKINCYRDYHDTVIHSFFLTLKVKPMEGNLKIDPFNRTNWKNSIDLTGSNNCKGGKVYYTFIVWERDLN